jgi:hypothetical protein
MALGDRTYKEIDRRLTESFYIKELPFECGFVSSVRYIQKALFSKARNEMEVVTELWKQPGPGLEEKVSTELIKPVPRVIEMSEDQAREVVERSVLLIGERGYCL